MPQSAIAEAHWRTLARVVITLGARRGTEVALAVAVRLTGDDTSSHDKFLPAALIALLLPHSDMPLSQVTAMVSGQLRRHITGYHMSKLTGGELHILTELAFAIDDRSIPIDYRRRRDLASAATLIDDAAWARMTREAGMRLAPVASARRYLYELLTGCGLVTAPPPDDWVTTAWPGADPARTDPAPSITPC